MDDFRAKLPEILQKLKESISASNLDAKIDPNHSQYGLKIKLRTEVDRDYLNVDILPVPAFNNIKHPGTSSQFSCHCHTLLSKNSILQ